MIINPPSRGRVPGSGSRSLLPGPLVIQPPAAQFLAQGFQVHGGSTGVGQVMGTLLVFVA